MFKESPIRITDSKDKANPGEIAPVDTSWTWKIAAIVIGMIIYFGSWHMFVKRLDWVVQNTLYENERTVAIVLTYVTSFLYIAALFAIIIAIVRYFGAKTAREKLVNTYQHQTTIDSLGRMNANDLAKLVIEVERVRAGTVLAPAALNYAPTTSTTSNSNSTGINTAAGTPQTDSTLVDPSEVLAALNRE